MKLSDAKEKSDNGYVHKFIRWQNEQYLPGNFLGSDFSPAFLSRTRASGIYFIVFGLLLVLGSTLIFLDGVSWEVFGRFLLPMSAGILSLLGGIRILKNR